MTTTSQTSTAATAASARDTTANTQTTTTPGSVTPEESAAMDTHSEQIGLLVEAAERLRASWNETIRLAPGWEAVCDESRVDERGRIHVPDDDPRAVDYQAACDASFEAEKAREEQARDTVAAADRMYEVICDPQQLITPPPGDALSADDIKQINRGANVVADALQPIFDRMPEANRYWQDGVANYLLATAISEAARQLYNSLQICEEHEHNREALVKEHIQDYVQSILDRWFSKTLPAIKAPLN